MYWTKKDKAFFLTLVMITTIIIVLLTNELYFKLRVEKYIENKYGQHIRETKANSDLSLELLENLNRSRNDSIGEYGD
jgi:cell division protein FtsL